MTRRSTISIFLVLGVLFALGLACQVPSSPGIVSTLTGSAPTAIVSTSAATTGLPSSTPAQAKSTATTTSGETANPTSTPSTGETAQPTTPSSPTQTPAVEGLITAANASSLAAENPIPLPEWPERLLWPGASLSFPEAPDLHPDLLTHSSASVYPVTFDPSAIHSAIPLPLNGNQVLAFAPDASSLVVSDPSQTGVYAMQGQQLWLFPDPQPPYEVGYSADSRFIVTTSGEEWKAAIYDARTGQPVKTLTGFETAAPVYSVIAAPGGKTIAWYARATLQIQDVATGQLKDAVHFEDFIGPILYTPDGKRLALSAAGQLMIYDTETGEQMAKQTLSEPLSALTVSPDGKLLAGIYGQGIQFWDSATLAPIDHIASQASLAQIAFSPGGKHLVTVSNDQQLAIWRLP